MKWREGLGQTFVYSAIGEAAGQAGGARKGRLDKRGIKEKVGQRRQSSRRAARSSRGEMHRKAEERGRSCVPRQQKKRILGNTNGASVEMTAWPRGRWDEPQVIP